MIAAFLSLLLLLTPAGAAALDLTLQPQVEVSGAQVYLQDLLDPAGKRQLQGRFGSVRLFSAPEPGLKRKVSRKTIQRLARRQLRNEALKLRGPDQVQIERKGLWIEPAEVEAVLSNYLHQQASRFPQLQLSLHNLRLPSRYLVPQGKIDFEVRPDHPGLIGSRSLTLLTRVDGQLVTNQSVRADLQAHARVAVVRHDLKRGDLLRAEDLQLQKLEISQLKQPFFSLTELAGKRLKRNLRAGVPLQRAQVEFPPLVARGSRVTIVAIAPGLKLTAVGEARENGRRGEMIRVRNNSSHRELRAKVVGAHLVQVEL